MINTTIGKYKITRLIGEGGMASVYEAEHEMLGTKVAIKVLNPILSANAQIKERFRNEAKLMASLDHPNITKVIDFDEQPQQLSIVMEFLNGEDLNDKIKRNGPLTEKEITEVFSQTLSAFQYAHEKGIVHRDIKPSNIFILKNGHVKILDFGIAKLFGQSNEMTQTGTQMGTPIYMSPEQVKADKSIDYRSDIYSLGVTMFYAINGKPPYDADTSSQYDIFNKIVLEPLPELPDIGNFDDFVKKACQKDREQRFQSCQEWLRALKQNLMAIPESVNADKTIVELIDKEVPYLEEKKGFKHSDKLKDSTVTNSKVQSSSRLEKKTKTIYISFAFVFILIGFGLLFFFKNIETNDSIDNQEKVSEALIGESLTDIDGHTYKSTIIGKQTWMAENLNVSRFKNGDVIKEVKSIDEWAYACENQIPAWCYYNNDVNNGKKYGKLYNWCAILDSRGLAPEGWHIPSNSEWKILIDKLGGIKVAGGKMKEIGTLNWKTSKNQGICNNDGASNSSLFNGLPGGERIYEGDQTGAFGVDRYIGATGTFWSASMFDDPVKLNEDPKFWSRFLWKVTLDCQNTEAIIDGYHISAGLSVRCLRDK